MPYREESPVGERAADDDVDTIEVLDRFDDRRGEYLLKLVPALVIATVPAAALVMHALDWGGAGWWIGTGLVVLVAFVAPAFARSGFVSFERTNVGLRLGGIDFGEDELLWAWVEGHRYHARVTFDVWTPAGSHLRQVLALPARVDELDQIAANVRHRALERVFGEYERQETATPRRFGLGRARLALVGFVAGGAAAALLGSAAWVAVPLFVYAAWKITVAAQVRIATLSDNGIELAGRVHPWRKVQLLQMRGGVFVVEPASGKQRPPFLLYALALLAPLRGRPMFYADPSSRVVAMCAVAGRKAS